MLAELTHRCPLQCPYCSNPIELARRDGELSTEEWSDVFQQASMMGVLQVHLSGGEPTARKDLPKLVAAALSARLYTNLITAGVLLTRASLGRLVEAGLDHLQLSMQDSDADNADRIGNYGGGHAKKIEVAGWVVAMGLPLTVNTVVHRQNLDHLEDIIDMALDLRAHRLEIAHAQYYGWALRNRHNLMPSRAQVERATAIARAAAERCRGRMVIDYVVPDYFARRPKRCMDGWGSQFFAISPHGNMLPCHAAETIKGLAFSSVRDHRMRWIWERDPAFQKFRGTARMPLPCQNCEFRDIDLGGCRCQAFALVGDASATDPVCELSPWHDVVVALVERDTPSGQPVAYRRYSAVKNSR